MPGVVLSWVWYWAKMIVELYSLQITIKPIQDICTSCGNKWVVSNSIKWCDIKSWLYPKRMLIIICSLLLPEGPSPVASSILVLDCDAIDRDGRCNAQTMRASALNLPIYLGVIYWLYHDIVAVLLIISTVSILHIVRLVQWSWIGDHGNCLVDSMNLKDAMDTMDTIDT